MELSEFETFPNFVLFFMKTVKNEKEWNIILKVELN